MQLPKACPEVLNLSHNTNMASEHGIWYLGRNYRNAMLQATKVPT